MRSILYAWIQSRVCGRGLEPRVLAVSREKVYLRFTLRLELLPRSCPVESFLRQLCLLLFCRAVAFGGFGCGVIIIVCLHYFSIVAAFVIFVY